MSSEASYHKRDLTDHALVALVAKGDREAFGALVRAHQARVIGLACRFLGQADLAEDVAQDVFVKVWHHAGTFRPQAQVTTWLYRLTANACWDLRRRAGREARARAMLPETGSVADAANDLQQREQAERVRQAVAGLPDRQRLAVILHRYDGLSHGEISDVTGWSVKAVESCLVRAYEGLRRSLAELDPRRAQRGD